MDDDAGLGRARDPFSRRRVSSEAISNVLQSYAMTHAPDPRRIRARLEEGMRADGSASASGGRRRAAAWSKGPSTRRSPVPFVVAAAVAVVALGIPLGTAFLSVDPEPPSTPVHVASTAAGTTSASPSSTPSAVATPTQSSPVKTKTPSVRTTTKGTPPRRSATSPRSSAPSGPVAWPAASGERKIAETRTISGTFDGRLVRYVGTGDLDGDPDEEDLPPMFELEDGAVIKNVIIGAKPADGIHCLGTCTLQNVWWEDVGDDAATLRSSDKDDVLTVRGGGARKAENSVIQQNGPGTVIIRDFQVEDFGKVYRACGNCRQSVDHHVVIDGLDVTAPGLAIVGINPNFGDTASLSHVVIHADPGHGIDVCQWYEGVPSGEESRRVGEGPSDACIYERSDVTYTR